MTKFGPMVKLHDVPLISRPLALALIAALIVPTMGWGWYAASWVSKVDEKLGYLNLTIQQLRTESYTKAEAQLQFQRVDRLEDRVEALAAHTRAIAAALPPERTRHAEAMGRLDADIAKRSMRPQ